MPTKTSSRHAKVVVTADAILRPETLSGETWLVHGFSTRLAPGGKTGATKGLGFNLGLIEGANAGVVERNRAEFVRAITSERKSGGAPRWEMVSVKQVHSDIIHVVRIAPSAQLAGDGLITNVPGLLLSIKTADCLPILLADPEHRAVGAFHAGWRGTLARIVEKGVGAMRQEFESDPSKMKAAIGPGIHSCCYEVSEDLRDQFESQFAYAADLFVEHFDVDPVRQKYPMLFLNARAPGHAEVSKQTHLDLVAANQRQLLDAGVREESISISPFCTSCNTDLLFSHRAERGKTGRMMAAVGIVALR
jgi:polyphenol oxidase